MKHLLYGDLPCWYDLRIDYNDPPVPTLIISIHEDMVGMWKEIKPSAPIVRGIAQQIERDPATFYGGLDRNFGFEGALKRAEGSVGNFVDFSFEIPQIFKLGKEKCKECRGKKKRGGMACLYCHGTGKVVEDHMRTAYVAASSLALLFEGLYFPPEIDTRASYPQLFTVQSVASPEPHGAAVNGVFAPILVKRLKEKISRSLPEVEREMRTAYLHCIGYETSLFNGDFRTDINEGYLHLNCPGGGSGLDPNLSHRGSEEGYEVSSHNIDSLPQQFALLAGLGRLNVDESKHR
jgi:hypothetical protein